MIGQTTITTRHSQVHHAGMQPVTADIECSCGLSFKSRLRYEAHCKSPCAQYMTDQFGDQTTLAIHAEHADLEPETICGYCAFALVQNGLRQLHDYQSLLADTQRALAVALARIAELEEQCKK
ncbi:hypothetical protein [Ferrimicrobium acidiphilum]|uniref:hypothetical protein n=1 Tax=Ferrimicrobium acidiphilum TaxID=121039 RepID=UPI0023F362DC|nr:hypothetical protein [Ferrimicrobium acidiphilum]